MQEAAWRTQRDAGIDLVGLDGTDYDHVLDMACTLGLVPPRFQHLRGLERYFAMARGAVDTPALDMSKYLNTNYHFMVRSPSSFHASAAWCGRCLSALQPLHRCPRCQTRCGRC